MSVKRSNVSWVLLGTVLAVVVVVQAYYLFKMENRLDSFLSVHQADVVDDEGAGDRSFKLEPMAPVAPDQHSWDPFSVSPFDPFNWDPFQEMSDMQKRIDSIFNDAFGRFGKSQRFGGLAQGGSHSPKIDINEDKDKYIIRVNMPGADKSSIETSLEGQTLTIEASSKEEKEESAGGKVLRHERRVGTFRRTITLPSPIEPGSMDTSYEDGVCEITIDKAKQ